ncbi:MAG: choice-of-anchor D domain-containing protein [Solirubrobacterales bacterium]
MENDLVPFRRLVLLAVLTVIACGILPSLAAAAPSSSSPTSLTFNKETVGKTSAPQTVTISNPDPGVVQIIGVAVLGVDPGDFLISGESCALAILNQGDSCAVEVAFAPTAGGSRESTLEIGVEGETAIAVPLSGIGQTMNLTVPGTASFPATSVGGASTEKIALKNSSEAGVNVSEVKIEGADAGDFGIEGTNCAIFLNPSMGCELSVRFSPTATGRREATLRVTTDGTPSDYVVELTGEGVAPELTFQPGEYDFGLVEAHSGGPRANFTLRNTGAAAVSVSNLEISGPGANEFWIPNSNCWGSMLTPGSTCSVEVQFNANEEGSYSAAVSIQAGGVTFQAPLTARAERPQVTVSPAPLAFGATSVGSVQTREVTLTNTGHLPVAFFIALVSGGDISSFHLVEENCTSNVFGGAPRIFGPGESCAATIAFEPSGVGAKAAILSFFGAGEGAMQVALEGTAVAPSVSLSPNSRDFGAVAIGTAGPTQTFQLRNESGEAQTIDSATLTGPDLGEFSVRSDDCAETVLAPGASCAVAVRFAPQSAGAKAATLRLRGPGGTTAAGLSGEGTATVAVTETKARSSRGRVAFDLKLRTGSTAGGVTIGRARCASSAPCVVRLSGLVSGQIAMASGRGSGVRGLPVSRLKLAPGESAAITTALPAGFRGSSPGARLQISLHWKTGSARGATGTAFRLG